MLLIDIVRFILESVAGVLAFCLLLRTLMQWVRIHPSNPLSPFVFSLTDWLVKPLRKVIPGFWGLDCPSVVAVLLVSLVLHCTLMVLMLAFSFGQVGFGTILLSMGLISVLWVIKNFAYMLIGIVLIQVVLSWVNPFSPMAAVMNELSRPFLQPLRRLLPTIGNVDLSPMIFLLLLQIAMMVLQSVFPGV